MSHEGRTLLASAVAAVLVSGTAMAENSAVSVRPLVQATRSLAAEENDVQLLSRTLEGRLLAVGRLDSLDAVNSEIGVLGKLFIVTAAPRAQAFFSEAQIGDAVALVGEFTVDGAFVTDGIVLPGQYVPGASTVYLRGQITDGGFGEPTLAIGGQRIALANVAIDPAIASVPSTASVEVFGTQPVIEGLVLATRLSLAELSADVSAGTRKTDASVGTGKTDASVGTGKTDASVGTGKTDASVGTGKTDASVGTGKTDASVGTGKTDASVGTGKTDASVGTGKTDASVGTGKTDASVGTGKTDASVGTGKTE